MARRPTTADYLAAWRLDSELRGGHHPSEVLQFVSELQDLADARAERALPLGFVSPDLEPWWLTTVRRWFGR